MILLLLHKTVASAAGQVARLALTRVATRRQTSIYFVIKRESFSTLIVGCKWQADKLSRTLLEAKQIRLDLARFTASSGGAIKQFILPDIGEGIKEVNIKEWQIKVGDKVQEFDPICEVESDKATVTISSRFNGVITKIYYELGEMAQVGEPLVDIELSNSETKSSTKPVEQESKLEQNKFERNVSTSVRPESEPAAGQQDPIATLPSVRRLAKEHGVDLDKIKPTGKHNRILKEDVLNYLNNQTASNITSQQNNQLAKNNVAELTKRVPLRTIQKAMYKSMTTSLKVPHFSYSDEIDLTRLLDYLRDQKDVQQKPSSSSFAFFVKMVSLALLEYPELNASIEGEGESLVHKNYHNIGIAVDTKEGLIVPNIKNVESKSITGVYDELLRLRELAYDSKLLPQDLTGGTITLSNIGAIGGIFGVPVIVTPEIIIGALGRTRSLPRFNNQGQIEARKIIQIVWSADHRVVDGATLSRFSNLLRRFLERPEIALERMI